MQQPSLAFLPMPQLQQNERIQFHARILPQTIATLKEIAKSFGYIHGGRGRIGRMLEAIASGKLCIVEANKND